MALNVRIESVKLTSHPALKPCEFRIEAWSEADVLLVECGFFLRFEDDGYLEDVEFDWENYRVFVERGKEKHELHRKEIRKAVIDAVIFDHEKELLEEIQNAIELAD